MSASGFDADIKCTWSNILVKHTGCPSWKDYKTQTDPLVRESIRPDTEITCWNFLIETYLQRVLLLRGPFGLNNLFSDKNTHRDEGQYCLSLHI